MIVELNSEQGFLLCLILRVYCFLTVPGFSPCCFSGLTLSSLGFIAQSLFSVSCFQLNRSLLKNHTEEVLICSDLSSQFITLSTKMHNATLFLNLLNAKTNSNTYNALIGSATLNEAPNHTLLSSFTQGQQNTSWAILLLKCLVPLM